MPSIQKSPRQENANLRAMAARNGCQMMWSTRCLGADTSTTVLAHKNSLSAGKGLGLKGHDHLAVFACYWCHAELDQGRSSKAEKESAFLIAINRQEALYRSIVRDRGISSKDRAAAQWALDRLHP